MKTVVAALLLVLLMISTLSVGATDSSPQKMPSDSQHGAVNPPNRVCKGTERVSNVEAIDVAKAELRRRAESSGKVFDGSGLRFEVGELDNCDLAITIVTDKHRIGRVSTMILSREGKVKSYIGGM